jgi:uncharacterized protein
MASTPINIRVVTLAVALAFVLGIELLARSIAPHTRLPTLAILGAGRLLQTAGVLWAVVRCNGGLSSIGGSPDRWPKGLWLGALWSLGFALAAAAGMLLLHLSGQDPLSLLRFPLTGSPVELTLFFLVGGLIAPIAEEIFFRGILYTFFRRWGVVAALAASTAIFVALHATHGLPVTQIVGGLVFALAYETSRNLMVPITIHITGNLALFSLSMAIS